MDLIPNSLYAKFLNGQYLTEFPEEYFGEIMHEEGYICMPAHRWLKTNKLETYYEWIIPFDKNLNMIEDFNNGVIKLNQNMTIMVLRSRQNNACTADVFGIYDLASEAYTEVYIDEIKGIITSNTVRPSNTYRWRNGDSMVKDNTSKIVRKKIPVSKGIDTAEIFSSVLSNVREMNIQLPSAI